MKFAPLVLKHLRKNWIRTLSTVLAMSVCIFLFCTLQTVVEAVNFGLHAGNAGRLVTRHNVSLVFNLPLNYKQRVEAVPGVQEVVMNWWFGGIYRDPKNFFATIATEPQAFLEVYPEFMLPARRHRGTQARPALRLEGGRYVSNGEFHRPLQSRTSIRFRD
jgi:putative ABC transport system permease protein